MIGIRRATSEDAAAVLAVHRRAIRGTAAAYYDPAIIEHWARAVLTQRRVCSKRQQPEQTPNEDRSGI